MPTSPNEIVDYDRHMKANLARVFNMREAGARIQAIRELYADNAVLYEPETEAKGHVEIDAAVQALLSSLPPDFVFTASGPAIGHHGIGRLRWQAGPQGGPVAVNGMDVAQIQDGRIRSLHVFIEPNA